MKLSAPKLLLQIEGFVALVVACVAYYKLGASWTMFALLFLVPDVAMLGYLLGPKVGARMYNYVHTYLGPCLLGGIGCLADWKIAFPICLIWIAHIGFDRALGYGLKYENAFSDTHLSRV